MSAETLHPVKSSAVRDVYRFGGGPEPVLQAGTMGWTAADFEDPLVLQLWEQGRFEIIEGVLTVMPAAFFRGGQCAFVLATMVQGYCRHLGSPVMIAPEAEVQVNDIRRVRTDFAVVFGDDLRKFQSLRFEAPGTDWRDHVLTSPPTLIIESVSQGHEVHDRKIKRKWYAEFGVRHYWIVDAYAKSLECLLLKDGKYVDDGTGREAELVMPLSLPGLAISLSELWGG